MPTKTTPFSVRLSEEDAQFIANLNIKGATTPSEKIRTLIQQARENDFKKRHQNYEDYMERLHHWLSPIVVKYRAMELKKEHHSELVELFIEWVTEAMAFMLSVNEQKKWDLEMLEKQLSDRVFLLLEKILRLGVTGQAPCYDRAIIQNNIQPLMELIQIIQRHESKEEP